MPDQSVQTTSASAAQSAESVATSEVATSSSNTYKVGDVLAYDELYGYTKGIVFIANRSGYSNDFGVVHGHSWNLLKNCKHTKKIGVCTEMLGDPVGIHETYDIAKAYFSKPAPAYVPAVGDVVDCNDHYGITTGIVFSGYGKGCDLGVVGDGHSWSKVSNVDDIKKVGFCDQIDVDTGITEAYDIAEAYFSAPTLTGTYSEKQVQWIKQHGVTNSSRVKILHLAIKGDGGWNGFCAVTDASLIGEIVPISLIYSGDDGISLSGKARAHHLPYFVLEPVT